MDGSSARTRIARSRGRLCLAMLVIGVTFATSGCRLFGWGQNFVGQVGDGTTTNRPAPVQIGAATDWRIVDAGFDNSCGIREDGSLWCWGLNSSGQVGDGSITDRHAPVQVGAATDWRSVAANQHSCGIRNDGSLWCWGANRQGEASGDGTTSNGLLTPQRVGTASWKTVRAGLGHTCAIRSDDTLWCWGFNGLGALGDGTIVDRHMPVQIGSATWIGLSALYRHNCGIQSDNSLWCWGDNEWGQIGNGTKSNGVLAPVQIGSGSEWKHVTAGRERSCAIRSDDSLWCWGLGGFDGTTQERLMPARIGTDTWRVVDVGGPLCAIRTDSTLWCVGSSNALEQIGSLARWFIVRTGFQHAHALLLPE